MQALRYEQILGGGNAEGVLTEDVKNARTFTTTSINNSSRQTLGKQKYTSWTRKIFHTIGQNTYAIANNITTKTLKGGGHGAERVKKQEEKPYKFTKITIMKVDERKRNVMLLSGCSA